MKWFAGDADTSAFGGQFVLSEICRGVIASTGAERGQQQFGRSHTLIESALLAWLIAHKEVSARTDSKLYGPKMFDNDLQGSNPLLERTVASGKWRSGRQRQGFSIYL